MTCWGDGDGGGCRRGDRSSSCWHSLCHLVLVNIAGWWHCDPPSEQLLAGMGAGAMLSIMVGGAAAIVHRRGALGQTKPVSREFSVMWYVYECV